MTKRRWLKSVIATSQQAQPALPFQRANRTRPAAFKPQEPVQALKGKVAAR